MKSVFALILMTLIVSITGFAQADSDQTIDWKLLASEDEEFTIEMPFTAAVKSELVESNDSRRYLSRADRTFFYVFSDDAKQTYHTKMVREFINLNNAAGKKSSFGEFEIEKYVFSENQTYYHTILVVKSKTRVYAFQTVSPFKENASVERFFQSLKLKTASAFESISEPPDKDAKIQNSQTEYKPTLRQGAGQGSGQGNGQGNGTGDGSGVGSGNLPTPETERKKETKAVSILSKPRANYTDFARFYDITGKVVLRVTFAANGKIGAISVVSGLPFGLTEQSIAAARGITFQPALKEGVPYSVTKPVEYSFIIY